MRRTDDGGQKTGNRIQEQISGLVEIVGRQVVEDVHAVIVFAGS